MEIATIGGGCFWCLDGVFTNAKGVSKVISGYAGGARKNPTYENICSGATGHAEVVQITYDENIITYEDLLNIFFVIHDPTTLNRQGTDVGTQYRSVIFYHNEKQKAKAQEIINNLNKSNFNGKIVTELSPLPDFWNAEIYHQGYYKAHTNEGYCSVVITPKVQKFKKEFSNFVK